VPWEKSVYITMLMSYIEKENEKIKQLNNNKKR